MRGVFRLVRGRGPVRLVALVIGIALVMLVTPSVLRLTASRHIPFPVDEVRNPDFVAPYGPVAQGELIYSVWDSYGRDTFRSGSYLGGLNASSYADSSVQSEDVFLAASPGGSIAFPDGSEIELLALVVSFPDGRELFLGPDGKPLNREVEADRIAAADAAIGESSSAALAEGGHAALTVILRGAGPMWERRSTNGLHDSRTGGALAEQMPFSRGMDRRRREGNVDWRTFPLQVPTLHPTTLWIGFEDAETSYTLAATPGSTFEHRGRVVEVVELVDDVPATGTLRLVRQGSSHSVGGILGVVLKGPLFVRGERAPSVTAVLRDGTMVPRGSMMTVNELALCAFEFAPWRTPVRNNIQLDEVSHFTFSYRPSTTYVAMSLEGLTEHLGTGMVVEDRGDLPLTARTLTNESDLQNLLRFSLQVGVDSGGVPPLQTPELPPNAIIFPAQIENMTARELFEGWLARYPADYEIVVRRDHNGPPSLSLHPPGTVAKVHPTWRTQFIRLCQQGWLIVAGVGFFLALLKAWALLQAVRVRAHLQRQGYATFGIFDAEVLYLLLGSDAHRIPPFHDLASIPGVDPTSPASIARVIRGRE